MCKLCQCKEYDWGFADIFCQLKGWDRETRQQRCEFIADYILYETSTNEHLCNATVVTFYTLKKRACEDCLTEYIPNLAEADCRQ